MKRRRRAGVYSLVLMVLGCGGKTEQGDPPLENLTPEQRDAVENDGVDPALIPNVDDIPELECWPSWNACNARSLHQPQCCYGECEPYDEWGDFGICTGCLPPGWRCIQHEECCGECSKECSPRDEDCIGFCLLAGSGMRCHYDSGCASGRCVDHRCR